MAANMIRGRILLFPVMAGLSLLLYCQEILAAEGLSFVPTFVNIFGDMEIDSVYEAQTTKSPATTRRNSRFDMQELFTIGTMGYIYHPKFISFLMRGSGGWEQNYRDTGNISTNDSTSTEQYEVRAIALPYHHYNLEGYSLLEKPLLAGKLAESYQNDRRTNGAVFRYKKRPWWSSLSYNKDEFGLGDAELTTYQGTLSYAKSFFSLNGNYLHLDTIQFGSSESQEDEYYVENSLNFKKFHLESSWRESDKKEQDYVKGEKNIYRAEWNEIMRLRLPLNFSFDTSYRNNREVRNDFTMTPASEEKLINTSERTTCSLRHILYRSLYSNLSGSYQERESITGLNRQFYYLFQENYTKKVPTGRLRLGFWSGKTELDNQGESVILDEVKTFAPTATSPYRLQLNNRFADPDSIIITVRDPNPPFQEAVLSQSDWQVVLPLADPLSIEIISLPLPFPPFPTAAEISSYEFSISYSLSGLTYELHTRRLGYSVDLNILNELLAPFYRHEQVTPFVVEGSLPYPPEEVTTDSMGINITRYPYKWSAEYARRQSDLDPQKNWRYGFEYENKLSNLSELDFTLTYEKIKKLRQDIPDLPPNDERLTGRIEYKCSYPRLSLQSNYYGQYSRRNEAYVASTYSLGGNLMWRLGKTTIAMHFNYADSSYEIPNYESKTTDTTVGLNLRRKLF